MRNTSPTTSNAHGRLTFDPRNPFQGQRPRAQATGKEISLIPQKYGSRTSPADHRGVDRFGQYYCPAFIASDQKQRCSSAILGEPRTSTQQPAMHPTSWTQFAFREGRCPGKASNQQWLCSNSAPGIPLCSASASSTKTAHLQPTSNPYGHGRPPRDSSPRPRCVRAYPSRRLRPHGRADAPAKAASFSPWRERNLRQHNGCQRHVRHAKHVSPILNLRRS